MQNQIEEAKSILRKEGYVIIKITENMDKRMDECVNGEKEDCCSCCACVCLLNDI